MKDLPWYLKLLSFTRWDRLEILNGEMNNTNMIYTMKYINSTLCWLGIKIKTYII